MAEITCTDHAGALRVGQVVPVKPVEGIVRAVWTEPWGERVALIAFPGDYLRVTYDEDDRAVWHSMEWQDKYAKRWRLQHWAEQGQ